MATHNLGKFILTPKGSYSASATYSRLDVVLYQGSSYVCKSDGITNKIPTNTTYWQLLAAAGQATITEQQKQEIIDGIVNQGVVIDPYYNNFSSEEKQKLADLDTPNSGTLTIKRNGVTVGTFGANQSGDSTVNITVPTDYIKAPASEVIADGEVVFDKVTPNTVYVLTQATSIKVSATQGEGDEQDTFSHLSHLPTYIYVNAEDDIDIDFSDNEAQIYFIGEPSLSAGHKYRITVRADVWEVQELTPIQ